MRIESALVVTRVEVSFLSSLDIQGPLMSSFFSLPFLYKKTLLIICMILDQGSIPGRYLVGIQAVHTGMIVHTSYQARVAWWLLLFDVPRSRGALLEGAHPSEDDQGQPFVKRGTSLGPSTSG